MVLMADQSVAAPAAVHQDTQSDKDTSHRQTCADSNSPSKPSRDETDRQRGGSVSTGTGSAAKDAGGSVGSSTSSRPRNGSLRNRENDKSAVNNTTPKRTPRQRAAHSSTIDAFVGHKDRKTNNFKVGNVGMGGRIYLRPVDKPVSQTPNWPQSPTRSQQPQISSSPQAQAEQPQVRIQRPASQAIEEEMEYAGHDGHQAGTAVKKTAGKGARTDLTGRDSVWTKLSTHDVRGAPSDIFKHQPRPRRSMSESTADHSPVRRPAALAQTKAFKVVIDRPESDMSFQRSKARQSASAAAINIAIPHYKIGSPRFSSQGTPFLQSSLFNQSQSNFGQSSHSLADRSSNRSSSSLQRTSFVPPGSQPAPSRRHSHAALFPSNASNASADSLTVPQPDPNAWRQHSSMREHDGISPRIYDALAAAPNDPSVVKYSATGEVMAATPPRLIVQITAETFLDYELLSDFFLTVRSYLNTRDLLALLLARFEWAVNRFDDNGRIIRVRSFAAIRHWILNYFAYDFVPDRTLRLQFCRKLNAIFKVVQSRREMGLSDIKLIADLKKCWNGRCVMYWDRAVDNALEADILPGGASPHGKTDSEELEEFGLGSVTAASTDMYSVPASPSADYELGADRENQNARGPGHTRTISGTTSNSAPLSPTSDISATVMSCSIPAMAAKKVVQNARQMIGPVPAGQRPNIAHRISHGSSEAVREAHSLERQNAVQYSLQTPVYRSVLRGHLLPPASPYVTTAPTTPGIRLQEMRLPSQPTAETDRKKVVLSGSSTGPGMKNLIGNIRRALSSKTSSTESYSEVVILENLASSGYPQAQRLEGLGRSANVPIDILNRTEAQNNAVGSIKAAMRIDALAEQVVLAFQGVMQQQHQQQQQRFQQYQPPQQPVPQLSLNRERAQGKLQDGMDPRIGSSLLQPPAAISKLPSGVTSSSQSIVIFDDTGIRTSSSEGVDAAGRTPRGSDQIFTGQQVTDRGDAGLLAPGFIPQRRGSANAVEVSTQELSSARTSAAGTPSRLSFVRPVHTRNASQASSLRRVASYHSALNRSTTDVSGQPLTGDLATGFENPIPTRGLRRVPGGDLRANQNIADLEPIPRPKSTGSIATFSSTRESEMLTFGDRITRTFKRDRTDRPLISPGLTSSFEQSLKDEKPPTVSFIRTHSEEKPNRRPSFEAVVASFADIPDEEEGGIEATLMKLEGRYRKETSPRASTNSSDVHDAELERTESKDSTDTVQQHDVEGKEDQALVTEELQKTAKPREPIQTMASTDYARSEDSYNSTPLLERGADSLAPTPRSKPEVSHLGMTQRDATKSFLLDEHDDDESVSDNGTFDTMDTGATSTPDNGLLQPLHPPSPPVSDGKAKPAHHGNLLHAERRPPTPDLSPSGQFVQPQFAVAAPPTSQTHPAAPVPLAPGLQPRHMPFVLGHDSEVMFQQFTLIEKDALREIDWRDLVHMRWSQQAETITNWVSYLAKRDPPGIDMVTSRFNVMVKWALSEIVLTESVEERALVIIKYIHIAHAARRNANFATLLQLTIALTSTDCTRLKATWALVPQAEKKILADLEALVTPRRNFARLRAEMEDAPADSGCIPVLALYIHDLTYNSQKPAVIESSVPGAGILVNFERYRSTAVIVKNLLRLIDASSKYNFTPLDDVLSHCMWMACLPDAIIAKKSKELETAERIAR